MKPHKILYRLPPAGIFANKQLHGKLAPYEDYNVAQTLGLWLYMIRLVNFRLVVEDLLVK